MKHHPGVGKDLAGIGNSPEILRRVVRLNAFVEHIERLTEDADYRRLWPDQDVVPATAIEHPHGGGFRPVTVYTWYREGFVLSLEERYDRDASRPTFRWLMCRPQDDGTPEAIREAERQALMRVKS